MSSTTTSTASTTVETQNQPPLKAIITLFVAPVFVFANMYTTQAILPSLSSDFHVSAPTAGLTISLLVLSVAIGSLFYGPLSDVIGRKPVMVTASFLVAIPTLLCGLAPNFTVLVSRRAIQGFLMPGLTSVAIPYVNEEFQGKSRGLAMGIYSSGLVLGGLFARVGSAAINSVYGWRIAMLTYVVPTLLAALFMWLFLPEKYSKRTPTQRHSVSYTMATGYVGQTLRDMWMHLHNRRLVGVYIIGFTSFFGFVGIFTYLPFYLTGPVFRLPDIALSLVYLLWLTGAGSPIAGSLAARFGSRLVLAVASSCAILGLFITLVPILPIMLGGLSLLTLGMFSIVPSATLYLGDLSTTAKGTAASLYLSLYYFGGSFGGVLPGITYVAAGWVGVVAMCVGMVGIALVADAVLCK